MKRRLFITVESIGLKEITIELDDEEGIYALAKFNNSDE